MNIRRGLHLRTGYFGDRAAFLALADLLNDTFGIDITLLDRFGGPNAASMPFGYFDADGRCVANFSAFVMPLVIDDRPVKAVGYQSGAVRPDFRGQGLYRDLMRRAFDWAREQRTELGLLLTDKLSLYDPYGFEVVPQHAWRVRVSKFSREPLTMRNLSLDEAEDVALVRRLLAQCPPVSAVFAAARSAEFLLNACFDPDIRLGYIAEPETIVAWRRDADGMINLLDVVASTVPEFDAMVKSLPHGSKDCMISFPPDRLGIGNGVPVPHDGPCSLMIANHARVALPDGPFMLSPMAEF